MNLPEIFKRVSKLTDDNLPTVLSAAAIVGTAATAYLTARGTFKAAQIIADEKAKRELHEIPENRILTKTDAFKLVWPQYLPAAGTVITTVGCIVFANKISASRLTALAGAYAISEKRFTEYKDKVTEKLGVAKEKTARDELAQERVTKNPPGGNNTIIMGGGDVLFQDSMSGRYFMSDMESVRKAINDLNQEMIHSMYVTLTDFYSAVGIEPTKFSDDVGWAVDNGPLEGNFPTTLANGNRPCIVIDFNHDPVPIRGYSFSG